MNLVFINCLSLIQNPLLLSYRGSGCQSSFISCSFLLDSSLLVDLTLDFDVPSSTQVPQTSHRATFSTKISSLCSRHTFFVDLNSLSDISACKQNIKPAFSRELASLENFHILINQTISLLQRTHTTRTRHMMMKFNLQALLWFALLTSALPASSSSQARKITSLAQTNSAFTIYDFLISNVKTSTFYDGGSSLLNTSLACTSLSSPRPMSALIVKQS